MIEDAEELAVTDFSIRGANGPVPKLYGQAIVELARRDKRVVCLGADLTSATETDLFRQAFPDRFFNVGIAEANLIGVAGGMARSGDIPFLHSFSVFVTRRCFDQIAMQIAYPKLNVKLVGFLPGLTTMLGVSHQSIDDIALMRALPNMTIIEPAGPEQIIGAVTAAMQCEGPVYLRLTKFTAALPDDFQHQSLRPGKIDVLRKGTDGLLLAAGNMVESALEASQILARDDLQTTVANVSTIKPLDSAIVELASTCGTVVTAENHSIVGGLGSAVTELLMESGAHVGFARVGVRDTFAEGGSTPYLRRKYGLTAEDIVSAFKNARRQRIPC